MITLREPARHVVEITVRHAFDAGDVEHARAMLLSPPRDGGHVSLLVDLKDMHDDSPEGLVVDLRGVLALATDLPLVRNVAVLANTPSIGALTPVDGTRLLDGEVRLFAAANRDRALAWLSRAASNPTTARTMTRTASPRRLGPAIRALRTSEPSVLALEIDGQVNRADLSGIAPMLRRTIAEHDDVGLLVRLVSWKGVSHEVRISAEFEPLCTDLRRRLRRHAIVTSLRRVRARVLLTGGWGRTHVRVFRPGDEEAAWRWLGARPIGGTRDEMPDRAPGPSA